LFFLFAAFNSAFSNFSLKFLELGVKGLLRPKVPALPPDVDKY
jgi:hypothetical protein